MLKQSKEKTDYQLPGRGDQMSRRAAGAETGTLEFFGPLFCCGSCHPFSLTTSQPRHAFHRHLVDEHTDFMSVCTTTMGSPWMDVSKGSQSFKKVYYSPVLSRASLASARSATFSPSSACLVGEKTLQSYLSVGVPDQGG